MENLNLRFTDNPFKYKRRLTHVVNVGSVLVGGSNPIRIQSMTNTDLNDINATVEQIRELYTAGCEIVRLAIPNKASIEAFKKICGTLKRDNVNVPLVVDVHFLPDIAFELVPYVAKVRINPGNYGVIKRSIKDKYTNDELKFEQEKVYGNFEKLILRLKEYGTALRIGINHGSLSARMVYQHGNTVDGMTESAMEMLHWCVDLGYKDCIVSMKASDVQTTIDAYRLLIAKMNNFNMTFPIHLGVTEAGSHVEGVIKSLLGIGSLLVDGIGDTIRVSLTEPPVQEIPVAQKIVDFVSNSTSCQMDYSKHDNLESMFNTRSTHPFKNTKLFESNIEKYKIGDNFPIRVEQAISREHVDNIDVLNNELKELALSSTPWEILQVDASLVNVRLLNKLSNLKKDNSKLLTALRCNIDDINKVLNQLSYFDKVNVIILPKSELDINVFNDAYGNIGILQFELPYSHWKQQLYSLTNVIPHDLLKHCVWSLDGVDRDHIVFVHRELAIELKNIFGYHNISLSYSDCNFESDETFINAIISIGSLITDAIGNVIELKNNANPVKNVELIYNILQFSGKRITQAEYISCPTCGRTTYDVLSVLSRVKDKTKHLKGIKIAVMGCLVNGPGEMADADYGFIGAKAGHVNIYKKDKCIVKNVQEKRADDVLLTVIKENGDWNE